MISREVKDKRRLDDELDNDEPADDGDGGDAMECRGDSDVVEYTHFFQMNQQTVWNKDFYSISLAIMTIPYNYC